MIKPFTTEQQFFIANGKENSERLTRHVQQGLGKHRLAVEAKRNTYIYSPPGAGKTFTVKSAAAAVKVTPVEIRGASSMNAFVTALAVAVYTSGGKPITVWIDDCDTLFHDEKNLNVMKGALDEDINLLVWGMNMTNQINTFMASEVPGHQLKGEALLSFQPLGGVGVEVPTDNIRFIITSNMKLTEPNFAAKSKKARHEQAIYDRINYVGFDLDWKQSWGWVAHVALTGSVFDLKTEAKHILLDWMWMNWRRLPATSMRAVKDLAAEMVNYPKSYINHWEGRLRAEGAK